MSPAAGLAWAWGHRVPTCPDRATRILVLLSAAKGAGRARRAGGQAGRSVPSLSRAQGSQGSVCPRNLGDPAWPRKAPAALAGGGDIES